ncbi:hypothetical protein SAMN06265222_11444 [Neorhodopirellula lusitana]|uniref:Secreted protein n=1 Tax=Neorhodopirellula lusitana TaxID=445327 RepID=A0ABY1QH47_9BACT|nr:hypothetical protein [Neorhodopirellula lusitana]SMP71400.1 hypothetical protein SAMN06265222_11444 [Neorhodopirellula lusitana]
MTKLKNLSFLFLFCVACAGCGGSSGPTSAIENADEKEVAEFKAMQEASDAKMLEDRAASAAAQKAANAQYGPGR